MIFYMGLFFGVIWAAWPIAVVHHREVARQSLSPSAAKRAGPDGQTQAPAFGGKAGALPVRQVMG